MDLYRRTPNAKLGSENFLPDTVEWYHMDSRVSESGFYLLFSLRYVTKAACTAQ